MVIPTKPDGQDPAEWPKDWDLARQQELLDVLGDLAVPIPWTQDIRADWKKNYEDALGKDRRRGKSDAIWRVGFDVERVQERPDDFHLHVSRMLLADYANEVADSRLFDRLRATVKARPGAKVEAVAAYQNYDNFQADVHFADRNDAGGHKLIAPTAIFGWDFVVPEREEEGTKEDLKLLKKAVKMASTGEFIELRSGLNDWLSDVSVGISKGALTPAEARADMEKRVADYQKFMKGQQWKKTVKRAVKLGLAFAGIHASDQDISLLLPSLVQKLWDRFPVETPKEVDAIGQDNHFMETNIAYAERLPHAVGLRNQVAIDQGDV